MTILVIAGLATLDFVFAVEAMPTRPQKYRALDAGMIGGGGAANAAVAAARLGARARLMASLGDDPFAAMILQGLAGEGVDLTLTRRVPGRRSSFSSVLVDAAGDRLIVNFREDGLPEPPDEADLGVFDAALSDTRWPAGAATLMRAARAAGVPGVMDGEAPVAIAAEALALASHVAFSAQGLRDFAGIEDLEDALPVADDRLGGFVCVTDGADGVSWIEDGRVVNEPAVPIKAVETLGAGDVWHAAFALALGEGERERAAIRFANAVAAIKCGRAGGRVSYPARREVEALLGVHA